MIYFIEANWKWISQDDSVRFAHSIIGIICISLTIIQVLYTLFLFDYVMLDLFVYLKKGVIGFSHSFLRIDKSGRKILHGIHRSIGISAYILASINTKLNIKLF